MPNTRPCGSRSRGCSSVAVWLIIACGTVCSLIEARELLSTRPRAQVTYPLQRDHGRTVTRGLDRGGEGPAPWTLVSGTLAPHLPPSDQMGKLARAIQTWCWTRVKLT